MGNLGKMVDMKRDPKERDEIPSFKDAPDYPCGLCISLTEEELEKLGLSHEEFDPGDIIHLQAFAMVTSVSQSANRDNSHCRVELTLTHIGAEDEETEVNEEPETRPYF